MISRHVIIDFDVVGFHYYPDPPKEVDFLKYNHRHLFQIKCNWLVGHNEREKEIFIYTDKVKEWLENEFGLPCDFKNMSCESIAEKILNKFDCYSVSVLEDGKGGAKLER